MARELPNRPSLDHLRKQAKDRLAELLPSRPEAQLADAQFALAREYGFESWPKLKAHVERVLSETPPAEHPFVGAWVANIAKSTPHPLNPIRSARVDITVAGDAVTLDDIVVDAAGREDRHRNTLHADGEEHLSDYGNGYVIRAIWRGPRVLEVSGRQREQPAGRVVYEVSVDGRTLTVSDPTSDQVTVFDRQ